MDDDNYLAAMGIQTWELQQPTPPTDECDWETLEKKVANCQRCPLAQSRTRTVFGVGNRQAELMIIGEAPGYYEDQQGEPFVGRAGQLLNAILMAIGLSREQVYIANVLKCRPPNNRNPVIAEVTECTPYLEQQVSLLQPKLMVAVGRIAAHYLLNTQQSLSRLRKQTATFGEKKIPLFVTYHPAYLLRNPKEKREAYQDWLLIQQNIKRFGNYSH